MFQKRFVGANALVLVSPKAAGDPLRRCLQGIMALCLVWGVLAIPGASTASANIFGFQYSGSYPDSPQDMEAVARSGATYWRLPFDCSTKNWSVNDRRMELAWQHGLTVIANPASACNGSIQYPVYNPKAPSTEWRAWETWLWELVQHYGYNGTFWAGKANPRPISTWELWNEPNRGMLNPGGVEAQPEQYAKFLKRSAGALREAEGSNITVLMGGLLTLPTAWVTEGGASRHNLSVHDFLEGTKAVAETGSAFNGLALHPYAFGSGAAAQVETNIETARTNVTQSYSAGKSLWITELGWPVAPEAPVDSAHERVSPEGQRDLVNSVFSWVEAHQAAYSIQSLVFYFYRDFNWNNAWDSFAGLRKDASHAFTEPNFRPAWYAYQEHTHATRWPVPSDVQAGGANEGGFEQAVLGYTVNPHGLPTHYQLEWGATPSYGHVVSLPELWEEGAVSSSWKIDDLVPGRVYHYRIAAVNENAEGSASQDRAITTDAPTSQWATIDGAAEDEWAYYPASNGDLCLYAYDPHSAWSFGCAGGGEVPATHTVPSVMRDQTTGIQWAYYTGSNADICYYVYNPGPGFSHSCLEDGPAVAPGTSPSTLLDPATGTQWIYYTGVNANICFYVYRPGSGFTHGCAEGGEAVASGTSPSTVIDPASGIEWVYYTGNNASVCLYVYTPGPGFTHGCTEGGKSVAVDTSPSSMLDATTGTQWIYYTSSESRICLYAYVPGPGFTHYCPETGKPVAPGASPSAIRDPNDGQQWVYYASSDSELCSISVDVPNWGSECLSGGEDPSINRPPAALLDEHNGNRAIYYEGANSRICLYAFQGGTGSWSHSCPDGGAAMAMAARPAVVGSTPEQWIYYNTANAHLCLYTFGTAFGRWGSECAAQGQAMAAGTLPAVNRDDTGGEQWSYYVSQNSEICMYARTINAQWSNRCLNGGRPVASGTGPASLRLARTGEQWVYYAGNNSQICLYASQPAAEWTHGCIEGGQSSAPSTSPALLMDAGTGIQWAYYTGSNSDICYYVYNPGPGFSHSCLEEGQAVAPGTSPSTLLDPTTGTQWIYYTGSNARICLYVYHPGFGFTHGCTEGGESVASGTSPSSMLDVATGKQWIYYAGTNSHVCLQAYSPGPGFSNSCPETAEGLASGSGPSAIRDSGTDEQWIYFRGKNGRMCQLIFDPTTLWRSLCREDTQPVA